MVSERWYGVGNCIVGGEYDQCTFFICRTDGGRKSSTEFENDDANGVLVVR
jgi:hypothetical protein